MIKKRTEIPKKKSMDSYFWWLPIECFINYTFYIQLILISPLHHYLKGVNSYA